MTSQDDDPLTRRKGFAEEEAIETGAGPTRAGPESRSERIR